MANYNYYEEVRNDVMNAISDYDLSEYKGDRDGFERMLTWAY